MTNHPNALAVEDPRAAITKLVTDMTVERKLSEEFLIDGLVSLFEAHAQSLLSAVETEVIGEDDKNNDFPASNFYKHTVGRNGLRTEQRQALNKLKGRYLS